MTKRQRKIMRFWLDIEDAEPDISTEALIERTKQQARCSHDELMDALEASRKEDE